MTLQEKKLIELEERVSKLEETVSSLTTLYVLPNTIDINENKIATHLSKRNKI